MKHKVNLDINPLKEITKKKHLFHCIKKFKTLARYF